MQNAKRRLSKLTHKLVNQIPEEIEEGILYVSMQFGTVVHKCACGCGEEVVTPLGPAEWILTYDGRTISMAPSIGNWSFPCRSHYWIERGNVRWARGFSISEVSEVRLKARTRRESYYTHGTIDPLDEEADIVVSNEEKKVNAWQSISTKFRDWLRKQTE